MVLLTPASRMSPNVNETDPVKYKAAGAEAPVRLRDQAKKVTAKHLDHSVTPFFHPKRLPPQTREFQPMLLHCLTHTHTPQVSFSHLTWPLPATLLAAWHAHNLYVFDITSPG